MPNAIFFSNYGTDYTPAGAHEPGYTFRVLLEEAFMSRLVSIIAALLLLFGLAAVLPARADEPASGQGSTLSQTGDKVKEGAGQVKDGVVEGAGAVKDAAVEGAHKVKEGATAGAQEIKQDTHGLGDKIKQAAKEAWQATKGAFSSNSQSSQPQKGEDQK
jgi:hypothetical protein